MRATTIETLVGVLEQYGRRLSDGGVRVWLKAVSDLPEDGVVAALGRWGATERVAPVPADIRAMLDPAGEYPDPERAWAMARPLVGDERASAVVLPEMLAALSGLDDLDEVAARMAFKASYQDAVSNARARGERPQWRLSMGWDQGGRLAAVQRFLALMPGAAVEGVAALVQEDDTPLLLEPVRRLAAEKRANG